MHKRLFASRFPAGSSQAAENDIDRIDHLRQRIRELRIVRVKYAGDIASGRRVGAAMDLISGALSSIRSK
jgi:hypothetical protein